MLAGCSPNPKEAIIGTWQAADGPNYALEFSPGGALKVSQGGHELSIFGKPAITQYRFTASNRVEAGNDKNPGNFKFSVPLAGDQLVVTGEGEEQLMGIRGDGTLEKFPPDRKEKQTFNRKL